MTTTHDGTSAFPLTDIAVDDYPRLTREGLGALKFNWRKCNVDDDWTKGGSLSDAWDRISGFPYTKKPSYDVDFGMRVIAKIAQEVPAWREIVSKEASLLTNRMTQYAAWCDWVEEPGRDPHRLEYSYLTYKSLVPPGFAGVYNSPGYAGNGLATKLDQIGASLGLEDWKPIPEHPYFPAVGPAVGRKYNPDPIYGNGSSNMMYKGFFAHQLMLAYVLSGDEAFTAPQHLIYDDKIQYHYSVEDMVRMMCEQHLGDLDENGSPLLPGIDCEVGKMFPLCVGVGGMATQLHDEVFGTNYVRGYDVWLQWVKENMAGGASSPDGGFSWCAPYYDRDIPYCFSEPHQQLTPFFIGTALHLLHREPVHANRIYEGMMENFSRQDDDGLRIVWPPATVGVDGVTDIESTSCAVSYALEVGDVERAEGLRQWMSVNGGQTYEDGEFYFTYGRNETWPRGLCNAWATIGYIGDAGSIRRMYKNPNLDKFHQPTVQGIDYPGVNVTQATYDAGKDALILSIAPGTAAAGTDTTFEVVNYPAGGSQHEILMDDHPYDSWADSGPGAITVRTTVDNHSFVIR